MKSATVLSRAEMKNVMGGVMDKETTLQWCLDHIYQDITDDDPIANINIIETATRACWEAYDKMIS